MTELRQARTTAPTRITECAPRPFAEKRQFVVSLLSPRNSPSHHGASKVYKHKSDYVNTQIENCTSDTVMHAPLLSSPPLPLHDAGNSDGQQEAPRTPVKLPDSGSWSSSFQFICSRGSSWVSTVWNFELVQLLETQ